MADPAEEQYALAVGLYARGDWPLAARELQAFLTQYPQHPHARRAGFLLGEALLQLGQYPDALRRFTEYLQQEPQGAWSAKALFRSGEAAYFAGQKDQAKSFLQEFLGRYPADPLAAYAWNYLGQLARKENHLPAAADYFQQCLDRFPQSPVRIECQLALAQTWEAQGKAEQALALYQAVAQQGTDPVAREALFRLAIGLYNLQRYSEAARTLELVEQRFAGSIQAGYARLFRGFALIHLKRWAEARKSLELLLTSPSPEGDVSRSPSLHGSSAEPSLMAPAGSTSGGTASANSANVSGGTAASEWEELRRQAQYWLGMIQRQEGQWAESAKTFAQLAQTASNPAEQVESHFYAGDGWLRAQDALSARKEFDWALSVLLPISSLEKSSPHTPAAGNASPEKSVSEISPSPGGSAQGEADRKQGLAQAWLERILRGKVEAAAIVQDHPLVDRTAGEFFQLCPQSPLTAEVVCWQAQSLLERKRFPEALQLLEPWQDKAPRPELAWQIKYLLACAYQGVGRGDQAQRLLGPFLQAENSEWKSLGALAQASLRIAQKEYAQAVPLLEAYLASGPSGPHQATAQAQLALCYAWLRQTDKARPMYQQVSQEHKTASWFWGWTEQLAEAALEAGDFAWASELFGRLANQTTDPATAHRGLLGLGWTQYRAGQLPEASATLARLLSMEPAPAVSAEAAFLRGTVLAKLRQPDAALALFEMVVDKYFQTRWGGPALLAAARLHAQLHQHTQALPLFHRYVQTFPKADQLDAVLYDWAWSLKQAGQPQEALQLFERIHREFPTSPYWPEATLRLAQQAYQTQAYERARQLVSAVLAAEAPPDLRPYALYLQMQVAAAEQQWDKVGQIASQLVQQYAGSPFQLYAEFWKAEVAFRTKHFEEARKLLEPLAQKAASLPADVAPWVALRQVQLLAHQGQWDHVLESATQFKHQYPHFDQLYEADYLLGRALARKGRFDEARQAFQQVIRSPQGAKTETAAMAQWYIGETYFHQRDYQTALRAYLLVEVLYGYPEWQALAIYEAARCREKLGQPREAQHLYRRLLEEFPNTTAAQEYRKSQPPPSDLSPADSSVPTSTPSVGEAGSALGEPTSRPSGSLSPTPSGAIPPGAIRKDFEPKTPSTPQEPHGPQSSRSSGNSKGSLKLPETWRRFGFSGDVLCEAWIVGADKFQKSRWGTKTGRWS